MTDAELQLLLDKAAQRGASEALKKLGLSDETAYQDLMELRTLLDSWRGTKKTIRNTIVQFLTTAVLSAIVAVVWMQNKGVGG